MVAGLEQAMVGMQAGGIRQVLVPYADNLSYPPSDPEHNVVGPKPTTFSGMRYIRRGVLRSRHFHIIILNLV